MKNFFGRKATAVAPDLIGCYLVSTLGGTKEHFLITETEAYDGPHDLASHASKGRTPRTAIMFGPAGRYYVYFVYGMHWMLNIVTGPEDYPSAVLIRGISGASGPARLTKKLGLTGTLNGKRVSKGTGLWVEKRPLPLKPGFIIRTPRIGVGYAGPVWSQKKYRFILKDEVPKVSGRLKKS